MKIEKNSRLARLPVRLQQALQRLAFVLKLGYLIPYLSGHLKVKSEVIGAAELQLGVRFAQTAAVLRLIAVRCERAVLALRLGG